MTQAILFDLGNVILEIDPRRTFQHWAESAGVEVTLLYERWLLDEAYREHETGDISFDAYIEALSRRLEISMPMDNWRDGWNELFIAPFADVQVRLRKLQGKLPLYAFTNTNATHEAAWRARYGDALEHFEEIFVSSTIGMRKPDIDAYVWVAAAMELAPEQILFLDDTLENIEGAREAGLQTAWIRSEADVLSALADF